MFFCISWIYLWHIFETKDTKRYRTALKRQIGEAIYIRRATGELLNDKEEFNRCELPMLSVSRQRQKEKKTEKKQDLIEETERSLEMRSETQNKRRDRSPNRIEPDSMKNKRQKRPR